MPKAQKIENADVAAVFKSYPPRSRKRLMALRGMILDIAARTDGVGEVQEVLKWGVPSYLTVKPKSGTTIRLHKRPEDDYATICVHCQTSLISTFREMYPDRFDYDGNRCILLRDDEDIPVDEVAHFIELALTYHKRKAVGKTSVQE